MEKNLTKIIAENSNYSRRESEGLIRKGLVKVGGRTAKLGEKYNKIPIIEINNKKIFINSKEKIYIKFNKPIGYVCTNKIFPGEKNIFSMIPSQERLFSIGRLDKDSCGLLILTNDGDLTHRLTHPKFEHQKTYLIKIDSHPKLKNKKIINKLKDDFKKGIDIGDKTIAKVKNITEIQEGEFRIILTEGKKRQIRKMFESINLKILSLKRVGFAGINLDSSLSEGKYKHLNKAEVDILKNK